MDIKVVGLQHKEVSRLACESSVLAKAVDETLAKDQRYRAGTLMQLLQQKLASLEQAIETLHQDLGI